jgi:hypothetical protein
MTAATNASIDPDHPAPSTPTLPAPAFAPGGAFVGDEGGVAIAAGVVLTVGVKVGIF